MVELRSQLHLLHVFSTFAVGGPQARFASLVNALGKKYRHTVLAMDGNYEAAKGVGPEVDCAIHRMPVVKGAGISISNLRNVRRILSELRPDLLCTYNWGTIEWSVANRFAPLCPQIHVEDGFGPDESPERQHRRRATMRRFALARCAMIVVPSHVLQNIATEVWGLPFARVLYLPNGIDTARFSVLPDADLLVRLGLADELVVGTVAALRREKNLSRLLHLFSSLPPHLDARLVIVGDGPERSVIEKESKRLGLGARVVMAGAMAEPERVLGRFDVFVLTSDTEQMPNSVLEAMAAGLPVLATDVGDVRRMLSVENGPFVVPLQDMKALGNGLEYLLRDRSLRRTMGEKNRNRVKADYDLNGMVAGYDALFERVARSAL